MLIPLFATHLGAPPGSGECTLTPQVSTRMYIVDASSSESPSLTPKRANAPPQGLGDLESPVAALTPSHGKDLFVNVPPTPPQHTH